MILQIGMLLLLLFVVPVCAGFILTNSIEPARRNIGITYICGMVLTLAIFEFMVTSIIFDSPFGFEIIVPAFTAILIILSIAGIVWEVVNQKRGEGTPWKLKKSKHRQSAEEKVYWIAFFILLGFQLYMAFCYASFDGDDAYYVVQSVATYESNRLYRILPYTGLSTAVDIRHGLAAFPIWISYLSAMSDIHPTIMAHSILQFVLIPITYCVYYEIGKLLLKKEKEKMPIYMIIVAMLQIFGNVSIYTNSTFFLTRTWQGKAVMANFILPLLFMVLYWIGETEKKKTEKKFIGMWIFLFLINMVATLCTTASVVLIPILIGIIGLILAIMKKDFWILLKLALTCLPCVAYGLIYITV
ncbi:MAG: DUF6077 domain-containing protein [Eubacteriales bacterium]